MKWFLGLAIDESPHAALYNFFQPVMRVVKTVISEDGQRTRIRRRYDQEHTPFDRLCDTGVLSPEVQAQLAAQREQTNLWQLLAEIETQLDSSSRYPVGHLTTQRSSTTHWARFLTRGQRRSWPGNIVI